MAENGRGKTAGFITAKESEEFLESGQMFDQRKIINVRDSTGKVGGHLQRLVLQRYGSGASDREQNHGPSMGQSIIKRFHDAGNQGTNPRSEE
jgi:hypothetical protein